MQQYINNSTDRLKVYVNDSGSFTFLEPGEGCEVDIPTDREPRVLTVLSEPPAAET